MVNCGRAGIPHRRVVNLGRYRWPPLCRRGVHRLIHQIKMTTSRQRHYTMDMDQDSTALPPTTTLNTDTAMVAKITERPDSPVVVATAGTSDPTPTQEGWTTVRKRLQAPLLTGAPHPPPSSRPWTSLASPRHSVTYLKFCTCSREGQTHYAVVLEDNKAHGALAISARLENRGSWLLTSKDLMSFHALKRSGLPLTELDPQVTERWVVVTRFPLSLLFDLLTDLPNISAAECCLG